MTRTRDSQRSRVYAWERRFEAHTRGERFESIDDVDAFLRPIWRAERGRVGLAKTRPPTVEGGRGAYATGHARRGTGRISLPKWARTPWVALHELAHLLTPGGAAHGPRFVGCLIGLLARHAGQDAHDLMALADEMGVRYHVRTIGVVPVSSLPERLARLLPIGYMDAALALDVSYRAVYGAALSLTRAGRARWRGKTLVAA